MLNQDIVREAARLTRAGQLVEATVLLQRMLGGKSAPDATFRTDRIALPGGEPPTIDAKANTVDETESPQLVRATSAHRTLPARSQKGAHRAPTAGRN